MVTKRVSANELADELIAPAYTHRADLGLMPKFRLPDDGAHPDVVERLVYDELMLDGALPIFTANINGGGAMGTMAWADAQFVLASDQFEITEPLPVTIDFQLRGLTGTLVLTP